MCVRHTYIYPKFYSKRIIRCRDKNCNNDFGDTVVAWCKMMAVGTVGFAFIIQWPLNWILASFIPPGLATFLNVLLFIGLSFYVLVIKIFLQVTGFNFDPK